MVKDLVGKNINGSYPSSVETYKCMECETEGSEDLWKNGRCPVCKKEVELSISTAISIGGKRLRSRKKV